MQRREPKTNRARRVLKTMAPKVEENPKKALFIKGPHSSDLVNKTMQSLYMLKKPHAVQLQKKNEWYPFETTKHLEFLTFKNDTSLFMFGSSQKKRPHSIVIGRMFDFQTLDMLELGVTAFEALSGKSMFTSERPPLFCFLGSDFDTNPQLKHVQNLFLDFFNNGNPKLLNLGTLERVVCVTAKPPTNPTETLEGFQLLFRHYLVEYKQAGSQTPAVKLTLTGPSIDFVVRRTRLADADMFKAACWVPSSTFGKGKKKKNLTTDGLANLRGQIHVGKPDYDTLALRKFKASKVSKRRLKDEARDAKAEGKAREAGEGDEPLAKRPRLGLVHVEGKPIMREKKDHVDRKLIASAPKKKRVKMQL
eukprot:NODE_2187_length_1256_cov_127.437555_g2079_i0.p1 GENE.NODE_2187_length_1256_cov_127.437555_g2079_i0~~NODE_2187_length_1256_cov_127.437555_g2079_i0.p1  ORF type:complete len:363 (-),score=107.21 NODE_2187_length_1256_cov_127.437555_g2079_i0:105-1193(-)